MSEVILRPIESNSWTKHNSWVGPRYKNCKDCIGPYFRRNGTIYTGIPETERPRLEKLTGLNLSETSEFWLTFCIPADNSEMTINTADPFDELKYFFLKSHKDIAKSLADKNPRAKYVMIDKESEAKKVNAEAEVLIDAMIAFRKMTDTDRRKLLMLYGYSAENSSGEVVQKKVYELVESDPKKFIRVWVDDDDREHRFLIEDAISKQVIRRNKNIYRYGTDVVGHSIDEAVAFVKEKKNQPIVDAIKAACQVK